MKSIFNFIVTPKEKRYNNTKKIGDKELILNTEIFNHQNVSRNAIVLETPIMSCFEVQKGDEVIIHHNIFRRWRDVKNRERNSRSWLDENRYLVYLDQIYAYKKNNEWKAFPGYSFIKPLKNKDIFSAEKEQALIGIVKYTDGSIKKNDLVGFTPGSEYEFIIDGERLYRVPTNKITIKYEYQGNEEEYNPSWA